MALLRGEWELSGGPGQARPLGSSLTIRRAHPCAPCSGLWTAARMKHISTAFRLPCSREKQRISPAGVFYPALLSWNIILMCRSGRLLLEIFQHVRNLPPLSTLNVWSALLSLPAHHGHDSAASRHFFRERHLQNLHRTPLPVEFCFPAGLERRQPVYQVLF